MPGDPSSLLRVRRAALGEARRALEASLGTEAAAEAAARDAERAIEIESDAAHVLTADDGAVEAFAAWLPRARRRADLDREAVATAPPEPRTDVEPIATVGRLQAQEEAVMGEIRSGVLRQAAASLLAAALLPRQ